MKDQATLRLSRGPHDLVQQQSDDGAAPELNLAVWHATRADWLVAGR